MQKDVQAHDSIAGPRAVESPGDLPEKSCPESVVSQPLVFHMCRVSCIPVIATADVQAGMGCMQRARLGHL